MMQLDSTSRLLPAPAVALSLTALLLSGCPGGRGVSGEPEPTAQPEPPVEFGQTRGVVACDLDTVKAHPDKRCFTYRAVAGVSMGGGTAARLGFTYPELFDVVGIMGTPFADNEFFWGMLESNYFAGFCPLETLEAAMLVDPDALNDKDNPDLWCGQHDTWDPDGPVEVNQSQIDPTYLPAVEGSQCGLLRSDYNHWYRGPDEGRGGGFGRNSLI